MNTGDLRGPAPSVGLPVLMLVFMTFAGMFLVAALAFQSGPDALRFVFMGLTLAPILAGWWLLWRSRRDGRLLPLFPVVVVLVCQVVQVVARHTFGLVDGRRPSSVDRGALLLFLGGLLLAVFRNRRKA
ncbi:hypothetical protein [Deinococcus phoenicis]|uniref:hypothetical protein n=1 Tax=Deinococcus phoenicis TaxID=1476583 RepID=UPI0012679C69|nr:hypothetical protein [Deinococcus phoenicis]